MTPTRECISGQGCKLSGRTARREPRSGRRDVVPIDQVVATHGALTPAAGQYSHRDRGGRAAAAGDHGGGHGVPVGPRCRTLAGSRRPLSRVAGAGPLVRGHPPRDAPVEEVYLAESPDHDILRFHIAVDEPSAVRKVQRVAEVHHDLDMKIQPASEGASDRRISCPFWMSEKLTP